MKRFYFHYECKCVEQNSDFINALANKVESGQWDTGKSIHDNDYMYTLIFTGVINEAQMPEFIDYIRDNDECFSANNPMFEEII